MITDEMLYDAANKAHEALLHTLPNSRECEHQFSKQFERKMRKLIRRTKYHTAYYALKAVACLFLVIVLSCTMFLATNVKAREAFFAWVKETCDCLIEYYFDGMVSDEEIERNESVEYRLGWVPEGYVESDIAISSNSTVIIYENAYKNLIQFKYYKNPTATNLLLLEKGIYTHSNITFNKISADIYIANITGEANLIIWSNTNKNILFIVSAALNEDVLIKIAENVITLDKK